MARVGGKERRHIRDLAFMGFVEVIQHLGTIRANIAFCKKDIAAFEPDVLVLIDYPGFNLRIAKWAHGAGIRTAYYISPQIWAWKEGRVKNIKKYVDRMIVILPFEKEFYARHQYEVSYVGHPLAEVVEQAMEQPVHLISERPIIALLPGSRAQELASQLPVMLSVLPHFPQFDFVIAQAPSLDEEEYTQYFEGGNAPRLVRNKTYALLRQAKAALVTSGTATLETALFGVPQLVCYRGNALSYWLARKLIKVKYICLVNLILDRPAVPELIQKELNTENLVAMLHRILPGGALHAPMLQDYAALKEMLKEGGASTKAAQEVIALAKN